MKTTGYYCRTSSKFDLDHEINLRVDGVKEEIKDIDESYTESQAKSVKKALIETILNSL